MNERGPEEPGAESAVVLRYQLLLGERRHLVVVELARARADVAVVVIAEHEVNAVRMGLLRFCNALCDPEGAVIEVVQARGAAAASSLGAWTMSPRITPLLRYSRPFCMEDVLERGEVVLVAVEVGIHEHTLPPQDAMAARHPKSVPRRREAADPGWYDAWYARLGLGFGLGLGYERPRRRERWLWKQ